MDFGTDLRLYLAIPLPHICTLGLMYRWGHKKQRIILRISHPPQPFSIALVSVPPTL